MAKATNTTNPSESFGWGDRVVDVRKHRFRGRQGMYRSACGGSWRGWHNILWDGRKATEKVRPEGFASALSASGVKPSPLHDRVAMALCEADALAGFPSWEMLTPNEYEHYRLRAVAAIRVIRAALTEGDA